MSIPENIDEEQQRAILFRLFVLSLCPCGLEDDLDDANSIDDIESIRVWSETDVSFFLFIGSNECVHVHFLCFGIGHFEHL